MKEKETNEVKKNFEGKFPNFNVEVDLPKMESDIAETYKKQILLGLNDILKDKTLSEEEKKELLQVLCTAFDKILRKKIRN